MSYPPIGLVESEDLMRGLAGRRRGRYPLLCWAHNEAWVTVSPRSALQASKLIGLQKRRGIRAAHLTESDAEGLLAERTATR